MTGLGINWRGEPFFIRIFLLYLIVVACITIVRFVRVVSRVHRVRRRKPIRLESVAAAGLTPEQVAEAALKSQLYITLPSADHSDSKRLPLSSTDGEAIQATLQGADKRFSYLWESTLVMVKSTEKLAWLTFFSTLLTGLVGATFIANGIFFSWPEAGNIPLRIVMRESIALLLARLTLGLVVCLFLYMQSSLLDGLMQRRRISWQYIVHQFKDEVSKLS